MDPLSILQNEIQKRLEPYKGEQRAFDQLVYWYGAALLMSHQLELKLRSILMVKLAATRDAWQVADAKLANRLAKLMLGNLINEVRARELLRPDLVDRLHAINSKRRRLVHEFFVEKIADVLAGPPQWNAIVIEFRALVSDIRALVTDIAPLYAAQAAATPFNTEMLEELMAKLNGPDDRTTAPAQSCESVTRPTPSSCDSPSGA